MTNYGSPGYNNHAASYVMGTGSSLFSLGKSWLSVKLSTCLYLVPRLMRGSTLPPPYVCMLVVPHTWGIFYLFRINQFSWPRSAKNTVTIKVRILLVFLPVELMAHQRIRTIIWEETWNVLYCRQLSRIRFFKSISFSFVFSRIPVDLQSRAASNWPWTEPQS